MKYVIKKKSFCLIFIFFTSFVFSDDHQIVTNYLKKAYFQVLSNKYDTAKEYLQNAADYQIYLPEYYYIKNLILLKKNIHIDQQIINTDKLLNIITKNTFITRYTLLKQSIDIEISTRQFTKAIDNYEKLLQINEQRTSEDYLSLLKLLVIQKEYSKIPAVVKQANDVFYSQEIDFYMIFYRVKTKNITEEIFKKNISSLESNNFSKSKILLLKIIFHNDKDILEKTFYQYIQMNNSHTIQTGYKKILIKAFLQKYSSLPKDALYYLLYDWVDINGLRDYTTTIFLQNKDLFALITEDSTLKEKYINFTGVRLKDEENDGKWEEFYDYKNGIIQQIIIDKNQDNIPEVEYNYFANGKINNYICYKDKINYTKLIFNKQDSSLSVIEKYKNKNKIEITNIYPSSFFPQKKDLKNICSQNTKQNILPYITKTIQLDPTHLKYRKITKYNNGQKTISLIDYNNNAHYEEKIFYDDNKIKYAIKDLNENNIYELRIDYKKCKIFRISYLLNENYDIFDYREEYYDDKTVKYWDLNKDGFFEIVFDEGKNGIAYEKIDVNNDSKYDYIYELKNGIVTRCFLEATKKWIKINPIKYQKLNKKTDYIVVSINDISKVKLPDEIIIDNYSKMSGTFNYKNIKYFFYNGLIKSNDFYLKVQKYDNKIYLFDISWKLR